MNLGFRLFRLQQIDTQLDLIAKRLAEIDRTLADDLVVREARQAIDSQTASIEATRKEIAQAEGVVKAAQEKLKENQDSLYGGKVSNPKELQDLQLEAENLTRHLKQHEDTELEQMMRLEEQQAGLQQAQANLEAVLAQRGIQQRTLGKEQEQLQTEKQRLQQERQPALHGISAEALSVYEGLRKSKGGLAVAKATGKECSACGAELSAALAEAARSPHDLARCDSCKRILYAG